MALENMAAQFKGLPMGDLIGGPLDAACDAQVRLARATVDFIHDVGFESKMKEGKVDGGSWGHTRTARFDFNRPVLIAPGKPVKLDSDGNVAEAAEPPRMGSERVSLEVPVLAIVNVPALSVKTVDITFDMEVKSAETSKSSTDAGASTDIETGGKFFGWGTTVKIHGSVSTHQENTRTSDNSAKYHVQVHAQDSGMPEGLARVLDILAQSVAPSHVSAVQEVTRNAEGQLALGDLGGPHHANGKPAGAGGAAGTGHAAGSR